MDLDGYTLSARHIVLYPHCNATRNCFGGQMLAWIDVAAGLYAREQMRTDLLVTVKIEEIVFQVPVPLGWTVTLHCKTVKEGRSSLTVHVVVTRQHYEGSDGEEEAVIETNLVFVAVDKDGKSVPWQKG